MANQKLLLAGKDQPRFESLVSLFSTSLAFAQKNYAQGMNQDLKIKEQ